MDLSVIKVPGKAKMRGRPKGRQTTAIGLPSAKRRRRAKESTNTEKDGYDSDGTSDGLPISVNGLMKRIKETVSNCVQYI